jgi:hypothetical protein
LRDAVFKVLEHEVVEIIAGCFVSYIQSGDLSKNSGEPQEIDHKGSGTKHAEDFFVDG